MISLLILLIIVGLLVGLAYYVADALVTSPPLNKAIKVIATVIGILVVVIALLDLAGYNTGFPTRPLVVR